MNKMNPLMGILRHAFRKDFNILTAPTHERYQSNFDSLPYNFYMLNHKSFVEWKDDYAKIPDNHKLIDSLPSIQLDCVLSQNKFGQFQRLSQFSSKYNIPLISLEHTLPPPIKEWHKKYFTEAYNMQGHVNVFISNYSRDAWGFDKTNSTVVNHCVDSDIFSFSDNERKPHILTVANDYIGRNVFLNYDQYVRVTEGLPVFPVGDSPGLSKKAESTEELVRNYQNSLVFLNTANVSPIPMSVLEASACGCCVISCKTCAIPEYIEHGVTGILAENDEEMKEYLVFYLNNPDKAREIGYNASIRMRELYSKDVFVNNWLNVFRSVM